MYAKESLNFPMYVTYYIYTYIINGGKSKLPVWGGARNLRPT